MKRNPDQKKRDERDSEKLRILYIEDNIDDQVILRSSLEKNLKIDFTLLTTETGTEGLKKLDEETVDLILLDYKLPGMTGVELLKELKKRNRDIDVIFVTGKGNENIAVQAMKLGARDYIVKDDLRRDSKRFVETIRNLLIESAIPKEINRDVAKRILTLFSQSPTNQVEIHTAIKSKPESTQSIQELLPVLTKLVEMKLLETKPLRSVVACPGCGSLNHTLHLHCPECNSPLMIKGDTIEHYPCGEVNFRSMYEKGDKLVCPKCKKELKTLGVDFRKIGVWHRCSKGHLFILPNQRFGCLECDGKFNLDNTALEVLHEYKLTEKGHHRLRFSLLKNDMAQTDKHSNKKSQQGN